jgi:hypothetical protein
MNSEKMTQSLTMAFTFLRSYQPDTEHPEEEEDEMPMPRSGSVRAISHLLGRAEDEDDAGWHQPSGPATPQARGQGEEPDSSFVFHPQEQDEDYEPGSATESPMDGRPSTRGAASETAVPRPAGMTGLPKSRLFEQRLPPGFRAQGSGQPRRLADSAVPQDRVDHNQGSPADSKSSPSAVAEPATESRNPHQPQKGSTSPQANQGKQASPSTVLQGGTTVRQTQGPKDVQQGSSTATAKGKNDPLTLLCEKFAEFPGVVEALKNLYKVPTGRLMIEKLATVADKIHVIPTKENNAYVNIDGMHLKKGGKISPDTLGHEFQHLGEILFNTTNPFLKVEDPADLTAYPGSASLAKEFRAMRIQNQLLLERYQMWNKPPMLLPSYYDGNTRFPIPGSQIPWN